jgi:hypothetical protein
VSGGAPAAYSSSAPSSFSVALDCRRKRLMVQIITKYRLNGRMTNENQGRG